MTENLRDRVRAAISDAYYDARDDGLTMEHAADSATAKVVALMAEREAEIRTEQVETISDLRERIGELLDRPTIQRQEEGW